LMSARWPRSASISVDWAIRCIALDDFGSTRTSAGHCAQAQRLPLARL
jgi:hypothetical protein